MDMFEEITQGQFDMFMELATEYNQTVIQEGNLNLSNYITNGRLTTAFEEAQEAVGDYQVNLHSGIDVVGKDLLSPFFLLAVDGKEKGSNEKIFSIIGTDLRMKVSHGDKGSVRKTQDFFKPGDKIMPFPKKNNFNLASTAPHFHIEISDGVSFYNPYTLKASDKEFKRSLNGGKSWQSITPVVSYQ